MKNKLLGAVAAILFVSCLAGAANATDADYKTQDAVVTDVEDGDTFFLYFVNDPDKVIYRANLYGVDAAGWYEDGGRCFAEEATQYLTNLILEKQVTVSWDSGTKVDEKEGRFLVYLSVGPYHSHVRTLLLF